MTKEIQLTQGKVTIVDDEDYEFLIQWKWYCRNGYAVRNEGKFPNRFCVHMHRIIAKTPDELLTDHINRNKLDNRRANLRAVTNEQNLLNRGIISNNTSGYKGVSWKKKNNKWVANISTGSGQKHLGLYETAVDAAKAYDNAAKTMKGGFAVLNFPEE